MKDLLIIIMLLLGIFVGWLLGIRSVPENQNITHTNTVIFKDCKEIKLDTISYNYRDSTYVLQVEIK